MLNNNSSVFCCVIPPNPTTSDFRTMSGQISQETGINRNLIFEIFSKSVKKNHQDYEKFLKESMKELKKGKNHPGFKRKNTIQQKYNLYKEKHRAANKGILKFLS